MFSHQPEIFNIRNRNAKSLKHILIQLQKYYHLKSWD
jgi:hypothetical protein